jgi:glycosyltransferase involved in cell wall biosynthesis
MQPLVTIITPAYNRASYLDETIQSVLGQDYPRIEYIVLDDGSKDHTSAVLAKYTGTITWESHPNMGETRTVNKGFAMAHGDIVAVINSDDPLLPGAIRAAVELMQSRPELLAAYPDWDYIDPKARTMWHEQVPEYDYVRMVREHHCTPGPGTFISRKAVDLMGGRDPEFRYVADFEYWLRLGLNGPMARIPKTLATFRVHPDSASMFHRGRRMAEEHIRLMEKYFARPDIPTEVRRVKATAFSWAHWVAGHSCGGDWANCLRHFLTSAWYDPRTLLIPTRIPAMAWQIAPASLKQAAGEARQFSRAAYRFAMSRLRRVLGPARRAR